MPVTVHWHAGEWPPMPDGVAFSRTAELTNHKNYIDRRCMISKIKIKPGIVPAHYKRLRDEALEKVGRSLGFYGPSFYND